MRLTVVVGQIVEFPLIVIRIGEKCFGAGKCLPGSDVRRGRPPSILVDAAVAKHLKVLDCVPAWRFGMIPRVDDALAFQRELLDAINDQRIARSAQIGRHLLFSLERSRGRPRPRGGNVIIVERTA